MRNRPGAADLLRAAENTLRRDIVPNLPPDSRFAGLMVANAIGIAAREITMGDAPLYREWEGLVALFGETPPRPEDRDALCAELTALNRRLVADIRSGAFDADAPRRDALRSHLMEVTRAKLAEDNPRYLTAFGLE